MTHRRRATPPLLVTAVVAGPDLDRRAEVARTIHSQAGAAGFAPLQIVRAPRPRPPRRPRGRLRSTLAVLRAVAWFTGTRRRAGRTGGLLLVDGSWFDPLLHPRAHGVCSGVIGTGRALAALVRPADVLVVVDGASEPHRRPGVESAEWAPWAWSHYAGWLGRHVVEETRLTEPATTELASAVLAHLDAAPSPERLRWVRVPLSRRDRDVRATVSPGGAVALAMPVPKRTYGRWAQAANQHLVARGLAVPTVPPIDGLAELAARAGVEADGMAAFAITAKGRVTVAVTAGGRMALVLKIGAAGDDGLRRESAALGRLRLDGRFLTAPLRWAGTWGDHEVVAMGAIEHRGIPDIDTETVVDLCVALHRAGPGGSPVTHGDLAPWNLLATADGVAVLDWEHCRFEAAPMTDLAHYLVQRGAQRDEPPAAVAATLTAAGGAGWRYLTEIGVPPQRAPELVRQYLDLPWARSAYAARVAEALPHRP